MNNETKHLMQDASNEIKLLRARVRELEAQNRVLTIVERAMFGQRSEYASPDVCWAIDTWLSNVDTNEIPKTEL